MSSVAVADTRPRFSGMVRAELSKVGRARSTRALATIPLAGVALLVLFALAATGLPPMLRRDPLRALQVLVDAVRVVTSGTTGILLLVLSARAVAQEADHGTIRVLLTRGTGGARLLAAKVAALGLIGAVLVVESVALGAAWCGALIVADGHGAGRLQSLPAAVPLEVGLAVAALAASMVCCLAIGCAAGAVGHRMAAALPLALGWFVADNVATIGLELAGTMTGNAALKEATGYLLGPNLNVLVHALDARRPLEIQLPSPGVAVDAPHALAVIALYCVGFLAVAFGLTARRRDVLD